MKHIFRESFQSATPGRVVMGRPQALVTTQAAAPVPKAPPAPPSFGHAPIPVTPKGTPGVPCPVCRG